ncbi:MAG TPA: AtpZ/AtpI family protein [Beijerinckiaceae bacterium]|jgi:ATP synthase protein I|nr:AtpZ/AtpI family protein [Beijerinckiaceae bacterium]
MNGNDAGDGRGTDRTSADSDLSARLKSLEGKLDQKRPPVSDRGERPERSSSEPSAMGRAFRMSAEFVAGVVAGGILGWLIDRGLGTRPWGLIVFLMLGFGAGIYNVMRASGFTGPPSGRDGRTGS